MALDRETVCVGQELSPLVKGPVDRAILKAYAAASGDPNPMHTDDEFARNAGYPGVFAHGMLSMGYLGEFLAKAGGGVRAIRKFRARFVKLTWPGDVVTCRGSVIAVHDDAGSRVVECDIWTENQAGERKLVGSAVLSLAP